MYICMYIYIYIIVYSTIGPFSEMVVPSAVHLSICRRVPVAEGETDSGRWAPRPALALGQGATGRPFEAPPNGQEHPKHPKPRCS